MVSWSSDYKDSGKGGIRKIATFTWFNLIEQEKTSINRDKPTKSIQNKPAITCLQNIPGSPIGAFASPCKLQKPVVITIYVCRHKMADSVSACKRKSTSFRLRPPKNSAAQTPSLCVSRHRKAAFSIARRRTTSNHRVQVQEHRGLFAGRRELSWPRIFNKQ